MSVPVKDQENAAPNGGAVSAPGSGHLYVDSGYGAATMLAFLELLKTLKDIMEFMGMGAVQFAKMNLDPKTSFYHYAQDNQMQQAKKQGDAIKDQAWGQFASMIVGAVSLTAMGAGELYNSTNGIFGKGKSIPDELKGAESYKNAFSTKPMDDLKAGAEIEMTETSTAKMQQFDEAVEARMTAIKDGSYDMKGYRGRDENGRISEEDNLTHRAVNKLTGKDRQDAFKRAEDYEKSVQAKKDALNGAQQKLMTYAEQMNRAGSAAGQGTAGMYQADDTTAAGKAGAAADTMKAVVQNNEQAKDKDIQNQQSARDLMNSVLQQMTSALLSQTRAGGG